LLLFASFTKFGDSAITLAAYQGHFDTAELLLKAKVFVLFS
jgi:ankyrin repeat protein